MDLLTNAIESLQVGVEDYQVGTRPRLLSAVRNIHAGVLLLFKEALRRRSPQDSDEALIKAKILPVTDKSGVTRFIGTGKRTVDTVGIRERFESLGIVADWDRIDRITAIRNDIEHQYPKVTQDSLRDLVASAFRVIRQFLAEELQADPVTALGKQTWQAMLEIEEVHTEERKACDAGLSKIDWGSDVLASGVKEIQCEACGSTLFKPTSTGPHLDDLILSCAVCSTPKDADTFVPQAIAAALAFEAYLVFDDGADTPYAQCPECDTESYVFSEDRCARCGTTVDEQLCARCGNTIPLSELVTAPLCSYCDYVMSKDD